jgi:hypothetical protein
LRVAADVPPPVQSGDDKSDLHNFLHVGKPASGKTKSRPSRAASPAKFRAHNRVNASVALRTGGAEVAVMEEKAFRFKTGSGINQFKLSKVGRSSAPEDAVNFVAFLATSSSIRYEPCCP